MTNAEDFMVRPENRPAVWLGGLGARIMRDGQATGGRFLVVEHPMLPRALGSPMRTHTLEDEYSFVIEGHVGVQIGDAEMMATAGTVILKPRGLPHAFWNPDDTPARVLELVCSSWRTSI